MNEKPQASPLISVIICTYNRCQSLAGTLGSLARMSVPPDLTWELIVIDNNSRDKTSETVNSFLSPGTALPLSYFFEASPGLSHARNRGIRESQGPILAFLDDDVLVSPNWLGEVNKAFEQYDPVCIGGRVLLHESNPRPTWWDKRYDGAAGQFDRGTSVIVGEERDERLIGIGANMIFKRTAFDRYGLFRTDLGRKGNQLTMGEETDMVQRLRRQKERIIYYPDAVVYHCPPAERFSKHYLRQHFYHLGQWFFVRDLGDPNMGPRIFSVPRWAYRSVVSKLWKTVLLGLCGRCTESFFQQLQCVLFVGYFTAAQKLRRAKPSKTVET
jgi:glucosyl-dolichyl phosphate glucuronosyltransferase